MKKILSLVSGVALCCAFAGGLASAQISNTGPGSTNTITNSNSCSSTTTNSNTVTSSNSNTQSGTSGTATNSGNTGSGGSSSGSVSNTGSNSTNVVVENGSASACVPATTTATVTDPGTTTTTVAGGMGAGNPEAVTRISSLPNTGSGTALSIMASVTAVLAALGVASRTGLAAYKRF